METPFIFGLPATDQHFIGREKETERLSLNLQNGVNTLLISPRRIGKTSLVKKVISDNNSAKLRFVYLDTFPCRSEYDFYNAFAAAILKQTASHFEEWRENATNFLGRLIPKLSFSPDPEADLSISLGINPKTHTPNEILNLPQLIAIKKDCRVVICIDEFQQIGEFPDALSVQKKMRSVWQHQDKVTYCLFGSKKHLMETLFQKRSYPFFKFGDLMYLDVIPTEKWIPYLCSRFEERGKKLPETLAVKICESVKNNSYYVQQLAWLTLLNTEGETTEEQFQAAFQDLIVQNAPVFAQQTEHLTTYQMNFLRAILDEIHTDFGSEKTREEYNLGTYSNINRIKNALVERDLIDTTPNGTFIADPVMLPWLRQTLN